jgi:hypothetical protein
MYMELRVIILLAFLLSTYQSFAIYSKNKESGNWNDSTKVLQYHLKSPYNLSVGSNFDFVDGVNLKDLFFEFNTFNPNLFKLGRRIKLGINTGVRKSLSQQYDSFQSDFNHFGRSIIDEKYFRNDYVISSNSILSLTNTNFFFSPLFQLIPEIISENGNKFSMYFSIDLNVMKHELDWTLNYDTLRSIFVEVSENDFNQIISPVLRNKDLYDQYIYSLGCGLPFIIENSAALFLGKFNIGYSKIIRSGYWNEDRFNLGLSFELIEKKFGLTLRSEFQYFEIDRPPFISFNIAKHFDLKRIIEFYPE